ncbi:MAG: nuclear transport factor 2 family protein [Actinomycetota bacterium]|nr:nuclear transport factor 2 family protein [Actinomycetota bacterium]
MMTRLAEVLDTHSWDALPGLLHENFICRFVHTGEVFDRDSWVRLNAEYPGFDHLVLQDCIGSGGRAAGRSHVTGYVDDQLKHFEVATFITLRDELIAEMTEVWTDVEAATPPDRLRHPRPIPINPGELSNAELWDAEREDRL